MLLQIALNLLKRAAGVPRSLQTRVLTNPQATLLKFVAVMKRRTRGMHNRKPGSIVPAMVFPPLKEGPSQMTAAIQRHSVDSVGCDELYIDRCPARCAIPRVC